MFFKRTGASHTIAVVRNNRTPSNGHASSSSATMSPSMSPQRSGGNAHASQSSVGSPPLAHASSSSSSTPVASPTSFKYNQAKIQLRRQQSPLSLSQQQQQQQQQQQSQQEWAFSRRVLNLRTAIALCQGKVPIAYVLILVLIAMLQALREVPETFSSLHHMHPQLPHPRQQISMLPEYGGVTSLLGKRAVWDYVNNPLSIPIGQPPILRATNKTGVREKELLYGASPKVWKLLVREYNIHSILTVHCGRGISTAWFLQHGVDSLCIEGNLQNIEDSVLTNVVPHDYMAGPWWPAITYDAAWVVNVVEHIPTHLMHHYIATLKKAAIIFVSIGSQWDQSHDEVHVTVHDDAWWITKMSMYGFVHDESLTKQVRDRAADEDCVIVLSHSDMFICRASSLEKEMLVFLNPAVAALPRHAHLFFQHGCVMGRNDAGQLRHRPCSLAAVPNPALHPIALNSAQDGEWRNLVKSTLEQGKTGMTVTSEGENGAKFVPVPVYRSTDADRERQQQDAAESELLQRIATGNMTNLPTITVVAWPYVEHGIQTAEHLHLSENGIQESTFFRLAKTMTDFGRDHNPQHVVWMGDVGWGAPWNLWCNAFLQRLMAARKDRESKKQPLSWPVYIVDFSDTPGVQRCREIEDYMGRDFVFYSTRSVALGRQWDESANWVKPGRRITLNRSGVMFRHSPLVVRTDTVQTVHDVLTKQRGLKLHDPIERVIARPIDVTHFWPLDNKKVSGTSAKLRSRVSHIVADLGKPPHNLKVFVGIKGQAISQGRRGVRYEYIDALLDSKIIVVTQRDEWEDHYRLFEAFTGGAMVMTDLMHGLPAGLQNGTSVIEFASAEELKSLILYYAAHDEERIAIAKAGREMAMSRHRSWHRMEEIILGQVVSVCTSEDPNRKCPYIVHGKEKDSR